jgi:hypothetical protein
VAEQLALLREAEIAAQSLYVGLTALRKADFSRQDLYSHAFFCLSIGLERIAKLTILIDGSRYVEESTLASSVLSYPTGALP